MSTTRDADVGSIVPGPEMLKCVIPVSEAYSSTLSGRVDRVPAGFNFLIACLFVC